MMINSEDICSMPIGMFDSGVGGLTVMREVTRLLPHETVYYFGDTAHFPYGSQSPEAVVSLAKSNTYFLIEQKIKLLVIACNTASAQALSYIQNICPVPVVDVISSGVQMITSSFKKGSIAILGTKGTIRSGIYQQKIKEIAPDIELYPLACPLLAPLVEEQFFDHPATHLIVDEYLKPLKDKKLDAVLLGCTHYPFLIPAIQKSLGEHVQIIDSASSCAWIVKEELKKNDCLAAPSFPDHHFFVTDNPEDFQKVGKHFLQQSISKIILTEEWQKALVV